MIPEIGHFALILALALALVQAIFPLIGSFTGSRSWMDMARPLAWGQFTFALIAFAALVQAFLTERLLGRLCGPQLQLPDAGHLQGLRRVGGP